MTIIEIILIILLLLVLAVNGVFIAIYLSRERRLSRELAGERERDRGGLSFLQKEIQNLRESFDTKIGDTTKEMNSSIQRQLSESAKVVRNVTGELAKLGETNKQVMGFAEQLKQLQDVLKNPKQRGVLGEYYLETVLQNTLPPENYKMQYVFADKETVDAVVFVKEKIIPIDSKFSLENYNRMVEAADKSQRDTLEKVFVNDLKLRIQETAKYIRPQENTTEFAFMFIPSEGIYYDLITNKIGSGEDSLIQRAAGKYKVIIVSPTSFLAYLQTVLQGLKALEIEEKAQNIIKNVENLGKHLSKYESYYDKLGTQLTTVVNHYDKGYKELGKVDKDILRITDESIGINVKELDKPHKE